MTIASTEDEEKEGGGGGGTEPYQAFPFFCYE
jgi:hypothetical protein